MRHYEVIFLVHPDQSEQVPSMVERYKQIAISKGGKLHRQEDWGRRQLSYPINDIHKAHYILMNIECGVEELAEIQDSFRFNDAIMRHMTLQTKTALTEPSPMMRRSKREERPRDYDNRSRDKRDS